MDVGALSPYAAAVAAVLVAIIQTRARAAERRKARAQKRRADRLEATRVERQQFTEGWSELVDSSREQWTAISDVLTSVRAELAQCEADRRQFILDLAQHEARLERVDAVLAGRIPPPSPTQGT